MYPDESRRPFRSRSGAIPDDTERDVGRAAPKRSSEESLTMTATLVARQLADAFTEAAGRSVRIEGKEHEGVRPSRIRLVDACRRADEAVLRLGDDEGRPCAHDPAALPEDHLEAAWVLVRGELTCAGPTARLRSRSTMRPSTLETAF